MKLDQPVPPDGPGGGIKTKMGKRVRMRLKTKRKDKEPKKKKKKKSKTEDESPGEPIYMEGAGWGNLRESRTLRPYFTRLDKNSDGSLSEKELKALAERLGLRLEELMAQMDADSDGRVTYFEFAKFMRAASSSVNVLISTLDVNGNGRQRRRVCS